MDITVEYTAVIDGAPRAIWQLLAQFEDLHWHPEVSTSDLMSGTAGQSGAIRQIRLADGSIISERLDQIDHSRMTLTYGFVGVPPIPVTASRTTVSLQLADGQTAITWQGDYEVATSDDAEVVTRISRELVWPITALALKSAVNR
ncbi:SRPBCC family protein [Nocardia asteroides]|nr:SRPBCC family protein [Nocardia asteroides]